MFGLSVFGFDKILRTLILARLWLRVHRFASRVMVVCALSLVGDALRRSAARSVPECAGVRLSRHAFDIGQRDGRWLLECPPVTVLL